jgi:hypothetical protein
MTMDRNSDALIAQLVERLEPVRPLRFGAGLGLVLGAAAVAAVVVNGLFGLRPDLAAGRFDPMHVVSTGLFLGLGLAASVTVIVMSRPLVGSDHSGWRWAAGMAALLPLAALIVGLSRGGVAALMTPADHGVQCFLVGGAASLIVFAALIGWLRRGAPTAPDRAGLVAGIAAGAFGTFAFALHCPDNDIVHIGLWHSAPVFAMAALGRAIVPRLIRW